jgi:hypothetical protein
MFKIEDQIHAEPQDGAFSSFAEAMAELRHRATLPWDIPPNVAPCTNWRTCGRRYEIVEYDGSSLPWKELSRTEILELGPARLRWLT